MSLNDSLANVLSHINNYEKIGKKELVTDSNSKLIRQVLDIMREENYLGGYEVIQDGKGGKLKIMLKGQINKTGVIKPRFQIKTTDMEKFEKSFLPAMDFGIIIISTNKGMMTHKKAKEQNLGGTLISYVY